MNRDKHITFYPSKGVGEIEFSFDEDSIIETLGKADEIDEDTVSDTESVVSISYYELGLDFFFEYIDDDQILSIHSDDIILEGKNIASLEKDEVFQLLKTYHDKNNLEFLHDKSIDEETDEESHYFDNIGLTLWYDEEELTDICCQDPDDM